MNGIKLHSKFSTLRQVVGTLEKGVILEARRAFADEDIFTYAKVTGDFNPLHFDGESAKCAGFEDRLVPGMLVATLFPQIISSHFPGAVYAAQTLNFRGPVYVGEEVKATVEATHLRSSNGRYVAKFLCTCWKNGSVAIDGQSITIIPTLDIAKFDH